MSDTFEELSARARRGELSRAEQQRLNPDVISGCDAEGADEGENRAITLTF